MSDNILISLDNDCFTFPDEIINLVMSKTISDKDIKELYFLKLYLLNQNGDTVKFHSKLFSKHNCLILSEQWRFRLPKLKELSFVPNSSHKETQKENLSHKYIPERLSIVLVNFFSDRISSKFKDPSMKIRSIPELYLFETINEKSYIAYKKGDLKNKCENL